jgi:serine/threonine protein kinase
VGNLHTFIKENKKLNVKVTREFTMEIINALAYLRDHNVVHRDLKPHNILLDDSFHVKLADFGASKIIDPFSVDEKLRKLKFEDNSPLLWDNNDGKISFIKLESNNYLKSILI